MNNLDTLRTSREAECANPLADLCTVYVDDSGIFESKEGDVSGIAALVARGAEAVLPRMKAFVATIEEVAGVEERKKGKVKGANLKPERYEGIAEFASSAGLVLCQLVATEAHEPKAADTRRKSRFWRAFERRTSEAGMTGLYAKFRERIESLSDVELCYGSVVQAIFAHGVAQVLSRGFPASLEVVFDPRGATEHFVRYLTFSVNLGLLSQFHPHLSQPMDGMARPLRFPWTVRDPTAEDKPGLELVDWMAYPGYTLSRHYSSDPRWLPYSSVLKTFESRGLYKRITIPSQRYEAR